jgi:hypothetical protein
MDDPQHRRALVARAAQVLSQFPNVHSVGLGGRRRAGRPAGGGTVFKVFVSVKKRPQDLQPSETIPAQIDGIPTDVEECPPAVPDQAPPEPLPGALPTVKADEDRYRPLRGGIRIVGANHSGFGTLGLILLADDPGGPTRVYGVTNFHVLFDAGHPVIPAMKVGQPKPEGSLTGCCPGVIGSYAVGHSDFDVDAALVQLDPGLEYRAEIEELGIVTGTHVLTQEEVDTQTYPVRKRGARTGKTGGVVVATDVGQVPPPPRPEMPLRHDIRIAPNDDPANPGVQVRWSDNGDSGAAVINDANEVVGIHFFGTHGISVQNGWGTAFPIGDLITKFFQSDGLDLRVATATATGQTKTVPGARPASTGAFVPALDPALEADLAKTVNGRLFTNLWLRNGGEAQTLINSSRKAATLWHRNNGPTLLSCLARSVADRQRAMPDQLQGKDVDACVRNILDIFAKYGGSDLREAASIYRTNMPSVAGKSFDQILSKL